MSEHICATCHAHYDKHDRDELACPAYTLPNGDIMFIFYHRYREPSPYSLDSVLTLRRGDKISVQIGDQLYTDTIESIHTEKPKSEPAPTPVRRPWWRRVLRTLTPRRWREPEPWAPPGRNLASTVITTVGDGPPYQLGRDIVLGERQDLTDPAYWTDNER